MSCSFGLDGSTKLTGTHGDQIPFNTNATIQVRQTKSEDLLINGTRAVLLAVELSNLPSYRRITREIKNHLVMHSLFLQDEMATYQID